MRQVFTQMIGEFQELDIPEGFPREIELPELPGHVNKAIAFIGMRRSGKTYLLYQLMRELLADGVPKTSILYLNFEDDRLAEMKLESFQTLLDVYYELFPSIDKNEKHYFFFDEIQEVEGWEKFIRRLLDTEKCKIYLSGSSAKMLSKEIATSLRGRSLEREVFPFSFSEYLQCKNIKIPAVVSGKQAAYLSSLARTYMEEGGFPETIDTNFNTHRELIQSYVNTVIYRDIVERYDVRNLAVLKRFTSYCLRNSATLLSLTKVFRDFKSSGLALSRATLYEYLAYLEDAYCLFTVPHLDLSQRKESQQPRKLYPADSGMILSYSLDASKEQAAMLESVVFSHLRRQQKEIRYLHTKDAKEVDFVVIPAQQAPILIQVSLSLEQKETRRREFAALESGMAECSAPVGMIVTLSDPEEVVSIETGQVKIVPLWKFLLQFDAR